MDKKTYVLKVLDILKDTVPLARGFMLLIQNTEINDEFLDMLIQAFQESIDTIDDQTVKAKLEKSKNFLETLKSKEIESKQMDQADLDQLDNLLNNI